MRQRWEDEELVEHWTLGADELRLIANKTGATRLGFAVLLRFFALEGRFPDSPAEVPAQAVEHLARQVGVPARRLVPMTDIAGVLERPRRPIRYP